MSGKKAVEIAEKYYLAMARKDIAELTSYLHPEIHLKSPFVEIWGKEKMLDNIKAFLNSFSALHIRAKFGANDQAMLAFNMGYANPIGNVGAASLVTIKDNLISNIELFFDKSIFGQK